MSAWARHLDDLAAATAQLLIDGAVQPQLLVDPNAAMAARDTVLIQLRQLVGSIGDAPRFATVRELTLHDVVHRPAQALHQALSELPRAVPFGSAELGAAKDKTLTGYERAWQQAARATIGLEAYVDALRELPDSHAWLVLRDLTDVAAALPYLDHDLSEAVLPRLKLGEDWGLPYRMLTHPGHDALRVVSGEVRARVPAFEPPTSDARSPARGPQPVQPSSSQAPGQAAATGPLSALARQNPSDRVADGPHAVRDLAEAMTRYTHAVSAHGANLSVADVKGVRRLLEYGSLHAATVLERAAPSVPGAAEASRALRATAASADRLREAPARSMTVPHVELAAASKNLLDQTTALAGQAAQLSGRATPQDLRRLAAPALGFAQSVPALAGARPVGARGARRPADARARNDQRAQHQHDQLGHRDDGKATPRRPAGHRCWHRGAVDDGSRCSAGRAASGRGPGPARGTAPDPHAAGDDRRPAARRRGPRRAAPGSGRPHGPPARCAGRAAAVAPATGPATPGHRPPSIARPAPQGPYRGPHPHPGAGFVLPRSVSKTIITWPG